jgi:hypothetical protein
MMFALALLACGVEGGISQPQAPPTAPARFAAPDDGVVQLGGVLGEISAATRSFVITTEGRLRYCVLTSDANVLDKGHATSLDALLSGQAVTVSGKLHGDVVVATLVAMGAADPGPAVENLSGQPDVVPVPAAPGSAAPGSAAPGSAITGPASDATAPAVASPAVAVPAL